MRLPQDDRFREERARLRLSFTCEDCALWDDARDACAHGYPTREHRRPEPGADREVVFCKDFELA